MPSNKFTILEQVNNILPTTCKLKIKHPILLYLNWLWDFKWDKLNLTKLLDATDYLCYIEHVKAKWCRITKWNKLNEVYAVKCNYKLYWTKVN